MRRRFEKQRSSLKRACPIIPEKCQKPTVMVLYIAKTDKFRITGHNRFQPEIFESHLKEHLKLPLIPTFYRNPMSRFRETDNFRITGHNRFQPEIFESHLKEHLKLPRIPTFFRNPM